MAEVKTITAEPFSGENTIKMVKNLLRYDIPFLLLGKSDPVAYGDEDGLQSGSRILSQN